MLPPPISENRIRISRGNKYGNMVFQCTFSRARLLIEKLQFAFWRWKIHDREASLVVGKQSYWRSIRGKLESFLTQSNFPYISFNELVKFTRKCNVYLDTHMLYLYLFILHERDIFVSPLCRFLHVLEVTGIIRCAKILRISAGNPI